MAEFVLKNSYFEFNEKVYKHISGTAIENKFAPPYACIFMDEMETSFLKTQQLQPFILLRYIDDIFFIWTHGEEQLNLFLKDLNEFHPNLKFTYETSQDSVDILDLNVSLKDCAIFTELHIKPTDSHQFLHFKSSHPSHIKNLIPYSHALRIRRLCSSQNDYNTHISNLKDWFLARDYPQKTVSEQIDKVVFGKQPARKDTSEQSVSFVATYHPKLKDLGKLINNLQLFLYSDFSPASIVSYRSARKIKDYIVRSEIYPIERKVGSYRCGNSRCQVCTSIQVNDTFSSFVIISAYKINHNFICSSKCLIYLLICKACGKQYTGKTVDKFRSRWNDYKTDATKAASGNIEYCKQQFLQNHFLQDDHHGFLEDVEVILIDKTQASDPTKREYYWMRTLKTLYPDGLNLESDY